MGKRQEGMRVMLKIEKIVMILFVLAVCGCGTTRSNPNTFVLVYEVCEGNSECLEDTYNYTICKQEKRWYQFWVGCN